MYTFRSQPVLQKTIETLFTNHSTFTYPGPCKWVRPSPRQANMCKRDPGLVKVLETAVTQALDACEDTFRYDRWNCSTIFYNKQKRSIFHMIYRETALVFSLIAASITHAVAKGCASGELSRCSCFQSPKKHQGLWKGFGCGDDLRHGKKITRNFLDFKHAGTDYIAEVIKQDVVVGMDAVSEQMREVCKCHGFSGSCTTKTCWKRLGPFNSAMGLLKKQYHHAVKKKVLNYTSKRAITPKVRKKIRLDRKSLVYLQKSPNLCGTTSGRICKDKVNCATLCCGQGYRKMEIVVDSRCKCRMVNCCFVKCDTCKKNVSIFTCK